MKSDKLQMHSVVDDAIDLYPKVKVIKSEAASSLYYHNECLHRRNTL
jgi:hypothetical protein